LPAEVRDLTAVLITHIHADHLDIGQLVAVLAARPGACVSCDEASAAALADRPVGAAWMKAAEAIDWLRVIRPLVAVPVHDHGSVLAEWLCHLLADLGPPETTLVALDGSPSTEM
jgi:L-ascorbate metabolism protein UlaG (beta-lactamase superfamily)